MKKLLILPIFAIFLGSLSFGHSTKATSCDACLFDAGSCFVDNRTTGGNGSACTCAGTGESCGQGSTGNTCTCQRTLGLGLGGIARTAGVDTTRTVPQIIGTVIKVILGISGTVALIFVVWGGIQWMISKGEPEKIKNARKLMQSGMIGIVIIAAAYAITSFVIQQITVVAGA